MKVREVMGSRVRQISSSAMLSEAADRMRTLRVAALPVVEESRIVGVVTDLDLSVKAVAAGWNPRTTPVREAMTPGAVCCSQEEEVENAARMMAECRVQRLVVLGPDQRAVGILTVADLASEGDGASPDAPTRSGAAAQRSSGPRAARRAGGETRRWGPR